MGYHDLNAHAVFGDTNRADSVPDCHDCADSVPDCLVPQKGPVYLEGRLVLSLSFQEKHRGAQLPVIANEEPITVANVRQATRASTQLTPEAEAHLIPEARAQLASEAEIQAISNAEGYPIPNAEVPLERYRLWDDLAETWYDCNLEVLRFEHGDTVVVSSESLASVRLDEKPIAPRPSANPMAKRPGKGPTTERQGAAPMAERSGKNLVVLWQGAIDTRARVIPRPDLDEAGMIANQKCDLRWKRV